MTGSKDEPSSDHWLVRPSTIRRLWIAGIGVLMLTLLAEFYIPTKGYFGLDDWPGFGAGFGFLSCLLMVLVLLLILVRETRPSSLKQPVTTGVHQRT